MGENHVYIGDIYRVGDCMIQISQGRVPCSTISLFNNESKLLKEAVNTCLTGYFARVINPGTIKETNQVILERRLQEEVTVLYGNRVVLHGEDGIEGVDRVLCVPGLSTEWRNLLMKKKKKYQFHTL